MARYTLYFKNGREVDFESSSIEFESSQVTGLAIKLKVAKKDKGMSLIYANLSEITAITRDTRVED